MKIIILFRKNRTSKKFCGFDDIYISKVIKGQEIFLDEFSQNV